jgi:hypothetical protein
MPIPWALTISSACLRAVRGGQTKGKRRRYVCAGAAVPSRAPRAGSGLRRLDGEDQATRKE